MKNLTLTAAVVTAALISLAWGSVIIKPESEPLSEATQYVNVSKDSRPFNEKDESDPDGMYYSCETQITVSPALQN
jgi:hypothetical protein